MTKKILSLNGSLEDEIKYGVRNIIKEECGLSGVVNLPSSIVFDCLVLQEHRGEKSVGIISEFKNKFFLRKKIGKVREQFVEVDFEKELPGKMSIGHNRYATSGSHDSITNIQPLFFHDSKYGPFAIAHNGNFLGYEKIKKDLIQKGVLFQSTTDSELFAHLMSNSNKKTIEEAIIYATGKIKMAYSILVFTKNKLIALRDKYGVRPLSIASMDGGYIVCSENYTFDQYPEAKFIRDVNPGEMVIFTKKGKSFKSIQYAQPDEHFCIFEGIYFSNPRTRYNSFFHEKFRQELGKQIFRENPDLKADAIVPILDSGKMASIGLSKTTGIPYKEYFLRIHHPPRVNNRSFTSATFSERVKTAFQKLHLKKEKVEGKDVIIVDDSIVRGTTTKIVVARLRDAGVKSITLCITSPPITNICPLGMDFQYKKQLIANEKTIEQIKNEIGVDRLIYLSLDGLNGVVANTYNCGICSGCFGGEYPQDGYKQMTIWKDEEFRMMGCN